MTYQGFDKAADLSAQPLWGTKAIFTGPDGIVQGTPGNDVIGAGFVDVEGDQIDGADGVNDTITGGGGNDSIAGGAGNDVIDGDGVTPFGMVASGLVLLHNTDNLTDSTGVETSNIRAVELVKLSNGRMILITSENYGLTDGMASYEIDANPASATFGQVINPVGGATNPTATGAADAGGGSASSRRALAGRGLTISKALRLSRCPQGKAISIRRMSRQAPSGSRRSRRMEP